MVTRNLIGVLFGAVCIAGCADQPKPVPSVSLNEPTTRPALAVTYFPADAVAESFAHGDVLFKPKGYPFEIHTTRRVEPGKGEMHAHQIDIFYVLSGEATFITGGTMVDSKEVSPGETRGPRVEGGDTHTLKAGDVIVVPTNTPHWMNAVTGEFKYFVVKVKD